MACVAIVHCSNKSSTKPVIPLPNTCLGGQPSTAGDIIDNDNSYSRILVTLPLIVVAHDNLPELCLAASSDPMEQADANKRGGCPFLDTSYVYKTYEVPALFSATDSRPIVLFDGECNLCNKFVQTLLKYDSCSDDDRGNLRFAALQSRVGELLLRRMSDDLRDEVLAGPLDKKTTTEEEDEVEEERYKSIVVCGPEKTFIRSSAVFQILQALGGSSKRLKAVQYLALLAYVVPTRVRDRVYQFVSKRRKKWFGSSDECLLWDDRFDDRFVDDGVLTGTYRDPFADPHAKVVPTSINLFEGESPPARGDKVRITWPADSKKDPSVSYDDEFPDGICIIGGTGTISTIDLPMRVVMRVDRESIGLGPDAKGEETMIAWVKPEEVAAL
eukprot:CAMPEP_0183729304 /NCGR_PEP_ID=MMETSP0737-20130205/30013_1 /TAXON_ID=385413 /ORGANISM="Thalassiosira miniscula, Strain CCMP1093" /LENGTH=385 /DNA_ID=CAMNT_0025961455 /DNA_START=10 /DNA_END=1168 /DNA_ORIENTATION=-